MLRQCGRCGSPAVIARAEDLVFVRSINTAGCEQRKEAVLHWETWGTWTEGECCSAICATKSEAVKDWNKKHGGAWSVGSLLAAVIVRLAGRE